jgi:hypothetical protein
MKSIASVMSDRKLAGISVRLKRRGFSSGTAAAGSVKLNATTSFASLSGFAW